MRVGLMAENPLESVLLATGLVPSAIFEAYGPASLVPGGGFGLQVTERTA